MKTTQQWSTSPIADRPARIWGRRGFGPTQGFEATPVIPIDLGGVNIWGKLERERPSGSFKDVAAGFLVGRMRRDGTIRHGRGEMRRLVVSSSGNFATALAHHTAEDRVRLTVVTDVLSPRAILARLARYPHVETIVVNRPDATNSHLAERRAVIAALRSEDRGMIEVDQYDNPLLPEGYARHLVPELFDQLDGRVGIVFAAAGTGGLIHGLCRFRQRTGRNFLIVAVDAQGSGLARPPRHGIKRTISGYGNGRPTGLYRAVAGEVDRHVFVDDSDAVAMCHARAASGLLLGGSSGAVLAAIHRFATRRPWLLDDHGPVAAILADGGESYSDTIFDLDWLGRNDLLAAVRQPVLLRSGVVSA